MNTDDPYIVIANLMAFRLARAQDPSAQRLEEEAKLCGEILYHAEKEGVERWRELRRKTRKVEKDEQMKPLSSGTKLSSSSAASFSAGDTP